MLHMRPLSTTGLRLIGEIAQRQGFSFDATASMLDAVINGNGSMAQFNHPEFSGSGQWMRGGMTMVSDMFNNHLKGRVDSLCSELSALIEREPDILRTGSFQSQSQGDGSSFVQAQTTQAYSGNSQSQGSGAFGAASLFVPATRENGGDWWPSDLRWPNSTGAQNNVRYAYFAQARRLVIDVGGTVTVYDTLDHQIGGFSQQQSIGGTLSFSSQYGLIDVASLPVISSNGTPPAPLVAAAPPAQTWVSGGNQSSAPATDIFGMIEKLADLRARGILSEDEFASKKTELMGRL